ncbi:MAG: metalloregulator ArsR/SmtB family transcription factor [Thermodesulfobacteriota bacterium]
MEQKQTSSISFCVRRLKALADTHRWAVIDMLQDGSKTVGELIDRLGLEQSLLSHHLKILRDEGLIVSMREGKRVRYRLANGVALSSSGRGINLGCCRLEMN